MCSNRFSPPRRKGWAWGFPLREPSWKRTTGRYPRLTRPEPALCSGLDCRSLATPLLQLNGRSADRNAQPCIFTAPFSRNVCYAKIDRNLVDCTRRRARIPESILTLSSPRSFSFDSRDQFSASAIQKVRLAGSRCASLLHSAARELSSDCSVICAPCLRELFPKAYDRCASGTIAPMAIVLTGI